MVLCSKIDLNTNLQVRCRCAKLNSHGKSPCTHEQLYTGVVPDVCARTAGKAEILHAPDGLLVLNRTNLALTEAPARYERPFSEDPLEDVLGGLSWAYILYQDGPVGRRASWSPVISYIRPVTALPESRVIEFFLSWKLLACSDYLINPALSLHYSRGKQSLFYNAVHTSSGKFIRKFWSWVWFSVMTMLQWE